MEQWQNNTDEDNVLADLFPDGDFFPDGDLFPDIDFSSILDTVSSSDDLQLEDNDPNQSLSSILSDGISNEYSPTTNGNNSSELIHILADTHQDTMAILDKEQFIANPTTDQNANILNIPSPQQASGSQDEIMYQMHPSLFDIIVGGMFVKQQPKANNRSRYPCDGSRFLPDSRYHPMSIQLPDLKSILLSYNETWGIVMTIVTDTNNPQNQTVVHANDIMYRVDDAVKLAHGCVFVPLEKLEIQNGEKKFPRLSIIYQKCDEYTFDLTPFNTATMFGATEKYTSKNKKSVGNAAKGKDFKKDYNLLSYKIMFQLALKHGNLVFISNIACETETVDEQKATTKSGKRSASISTENYSEEESSSNIQISSLSKKFKSSTPPPSPLIGLPVTRVSNSNIDSNMDYQEPSLLNGLIRYSNSPIN